MTTEPQPSRVAILHMHMHMSEFWSGDRGLTLVTISLAALILVVNPLRESGILGRIFFDVLMVTLMISGSLVVNQSRMATALVVAVVLGSAAVLVAGRFHPTPLLHQLGSVLATITLLLYVRIVLLVMFRGGPVTWSRIQGGVCVYLLLGMAWASAYQFVEQRYPGSFQFVTAPVDIDQLTSKLTYFSFGTLTTVGSDISALHPYARSLTIAEAIVGQLFPAIFIGALVAMAMQSRPKS
jgi:Ion channel